MIEQLTILEQSVILVFILLFFYNIFFRLRFLLFSYRHRKKSKHTINCPPVSVIICARNEQFNIERHLPLILTQSYPDYEVILVDDNSEDDTYYVAKMLQKKYSNLKVIRLNQNANRYIGKKFALLVGIKEAKNNLLLLTDADCYPSSNRWIELVVRHFENQNTQIVIGYGAYEYRKSLLNTLIRFDTMLIALQYISFAYAGIPYMGVGRNLAYRKKFFFLNNSYYMKHFYLPSGDDDLFVQQVANRKNIAVELSPESFTYSIPVNNFSQWFVQKKRHLTTSFHYPFGLKLLLISYPFLLFAFYLLSIVAFIFTNNFFILLTLLIMVMGNIFIWYKVSIIFREKKLFLYSPILELIIYFFTFILLIVPKKTSYLKWKNTII